MNFANTNKILLLHYRDLSRADEMLGIKAQTALSNTEEERGASPERSLSVNILDESAAPPFWRRPIAIVAALAIIVVAGKWLGDIANRPPLPSEAIRETASEQKSTPLAKPEAHQDSSIVTAQDQSTFTQLNGPLTPVRWKAPTEPQQMRSARLKRRRKLKSVRRRTFNASP
jgi:hypothetical protein